MGRVDPLLTESQTPAVRPSEGGSTLAELVHALAECAPKATLRGILVAVSKRECETPDPRTLRRMLSIARQWRRDDPLTKLEERLETLLEETG